MNPLITNPTVNAILQIVVALGTLASLLAPFAAKAPALYAFLQRLAAWGFDMSKAFGARRVPSDAGPVPVKTVEPPSALSIILITWTVAIAAAFLLASCTAAEQAKVREVVDANDRNLDAICAARAVGKDAGL